ncbi:MAG: WG repeat-containing protein [Bacteroidetes bacterium]|nr:WG repeat-containing protein [Bacteroidota bacterium]
MGFIDKTGRVIIPLIYDDAFPFSEGLARVKNDNKTYYINKQGQCIKDCP